MSISISSDMASSLAALTSVNDMVASTKQKINTGKAVSSPSDDIAVFFKAKSYQDKADAYTSVNANIDLASKNIDTVDAALSNMKDNLKGARQILADAATKATSTGTAVSVNADPTKLTSKKWADQVVPPPGGRTLVGNIVDASGVVPPANLANAGYFQKGDVIKITLTDASLPPGSQSKAIYLKAVDPLAAANPDQTKKGDNAANAIEFNDLASLATGLNLAFGKTDANFSVIGTGTTRQMKMVLASAYQSINFGQVTDAKIGGDSGEAFDFTTIFGNAAQSKNNSNILAVGDTLDPSGAPNAQSYTYSPLLPAVVDQGAIDARKQAADMFRQTIAGLDGAIKGAYLPGFANILNGDTMKVIMDDTSTVTQNVTIPAKMSLTKAHAGNGVFDCKYDPSLGTTEYTDTGDDSTKDFLSTTKINDAVSYLDKAMSTIETYRKGIAASNLSLKSRLDFNKTLQSTLSGSANSMTAADIAQESTKLAALSNQQNFAVQNLASTKQSEANLIQLLR